MSSVARTDNDKMWLEIFKLGIVLSTVYFVQGMGGLSGVPLTFYFKDILLFDDAQSQKFAAITGIAWLIKPLFGYISDRWPIFGYRRKSYMVLMAMTAAISWWLLALMVYFDYRQYAALVIVFNLSSLGYAFVDVACDALMVENGQRLGKETFFVNLQWFALGIGGFIAGFSGGQLQAAIKSGSIHLSVVFIISGFIPLLTAAISQIFIVEEKIGKIPLGAAMPAGRQANSESGEMETGNTVDFGTIKEILSSKTFWILTAFIFFWKYSPSFGSIFTYYRIDILKFDEKFLGNISAVGNAIFPLAIALYYYGFRKWFPRINDKHYLYAGVAIGLIYSALLWLYFLPVETFSWVKFNLPPAMYIGLFLILSAAIYLFCHLKIRAIKKTTGQTQSFWGKIKFAALLIVIVPVSLFASLWFMGESVASVSLSYRSLETINTVVFGYASIASFLIPLTLAAKLAPKKAEGMTYAYFMALSNISSGFLADLSGVWMFEALRDAVRDPRNFIAEFPLYSLGAFLLAVAFIALFAYQIKIAFGWVSRKEIFKIAIFGAPALFLSAILSAIYLISAVPHIWSVFTYIIQQSYLALEPLIGKADFLGSDAYRALILRYFVIIGAIFTLISAFFVYLLPANNDKTEE